MNKKFVKVLFVFLIIVSSNFIIKGDALDEIKNKTIDEIVNTNIKYSNTGPTITRTIYNNINETLKVSKNFIRILSRKLQNGIRNRGGNFCWSIRDKLQHVNNKFDKAYYNRDIFSMTVSSSLAHSAMVFSSLGNRIKNESGKTELFILTGVPVLAITYGTYCLVKKIKSLLYNDNDSDGDSDKKRNK